MNAAEAELESEKCAPFVDRTGGYLEDFLSAFGDEDIVEYACNDIQRAELRGLEHAYPPRNGTSVGASPLKAREMAFEVLLVKSYDEHNIYEALEDQGSCKDKVSHEISDYGTLDPTDGRFREHTPDQAEADDKIQRGKEAEAELKSEKCKIFANTMGTYFERLLAFGDAEIIEYAYNVTFIVLN